MTFQEAVEFKAGLREDPNINLDHVYVTPSDSDDFDKYWIAFALSSLDDKAAQKFCTNEEYSVRELMRHLSLVGHRVLAE